MNTMQHNMMISIDRKHIWHPYTSITNPLPCYPVKSAKGIYIELSDGRKMVDGMSSWWAAIHGYNHPILNEAITEQLSDMSHVMFGGLTHKPAVELTRKLLTLLPHGLEKVFYSDSGSVSIEVALKMAIQYWKNIGKPQKNTFMTIKGGYHGDTFAAMAVCHTAKSFFNDLLPDTIFAPKPDISPNSNFTKSAIKDISDIIEKHHQKIAAFILEPIVQGAGGMHFYHPEYLFHIRRLCDHYNILLIFDEIATGFGRTGKLWGSSWTGIIPDIMCIGKALTGGYMTLAATITNCKVAEGISMNQGVFMHGPTFMANPLACAVASASIGILQEGAWQLQNERIERWLTEELMQLKASKYVRDVRILGSIGVVEMYRTVNIALIQSYFVSQNAWIRPFGKLLYIMPPFIINHEELKILTRAITEAVSVERFYC